MRFSKSLVQRLLSGTFMPNPASADAGAGAGGSGGPGGGANGAAAAGAWAFPTEKAFAEYLPDTFKADPIFKDIKSFDGLLSTFVSGQKMVGADKATLLQMPKDWNDEKATGEFYAKQGRPETFEKYTLPARADKKAYGEADVALQKQILPVLHKAGVTQRQVDAIIPAWNGIADAIAKAQSDAETTAVETVSKALKTELGNAFDDTIANADAALTHFSTSLKLGDTLSKELDKTKLGNNPALIKLFAHLGAQLKEDGVIGKGGGSGGGGTSPAEAQQQIAAKKRDQAFMKAYQTKEDPGHAAAVEAMKQLYEAAYPA